MALSISPRVAAMRPTAAHVGPIGGAASIRRPKALAAPSRSRASKAAIALFSQPVGSAFGARAESAIVAILSMSSKPEDG